MLQRIYQKDSIVVLPSKGDTMAGAKREWPQSLVRIRPDLKAWLIEQSERNYSSINAEILLSVEERKDKLAAQMARRKVAAGQTA